MTKHNIHKYVGPRGFNRFKHSRATIEERVELTERFGEASANTSFVGNSRVSNFAGDAKDNPTATESLQREIAPFIGEVITQEVHTGVTVPYDGTEDPNLVNELRLEHKPTSEFRASLPA